MRQIPEQAIEIIKHFEGCRLQVYEDCAGYKTIGIGHLLKPGENYSNITMDQAEQILRNDLHLALYGIIKFTCVPLNDNQLSALLSFVFNLGVGAYQRSRLRMVLNRKRYDLCPDYFLKYDRAGGQVVHGLFLRRKAEADLFKE